MTITNKVSLKSVMAGNTPIADVPDAPTIGTATTGVFSATVTFTAAATGGAVTTFTATSTPGSITGTSATSPITVSGLTAGTSYTFKVKGTNSTATGAESAASNSVTPTDPSAGYLAGGFNPTNPTNAIEKVTFESTPVRTTLSATLGGTSRSNAGVTNNGTSGYINRANDPATTTIYKLLFSNETTSTLSNSLGNAVREAGGINNTTTAGYIVNGYNDNTSTQSNGYQKITYSNDTTSTLGTTTGSNGFLRVGMSNGSTAGYTTMGRNASYPPFYSTIDKLTYSNETRSGLSATAPVAAESKGGMSYSGTAGYWAGGATQSQSTYSSIWKLNYSNETTSTLSATLTVALGQASATASNDKSGGYGFTMGGYNGTSFVSTIQKLDYTNETNANISATLSAGNGYGAGVSYVA